MVLEKILDGEADKIAEFNETGHVQQREHEGLQMGDKQCSKSARRFPEGTGVIQERMQKK